MTDKLHIRRVPLFFENGAMSGTMENTYNTFNEYNEYISKSQKYSHIIMYDKSLNPHTVTLLKGRPESENTNLMEWEQDYSDDIDTVEEATVRGGPTYPFESVSISVNLKRISALYPDLAADVQDEANSKRDGSELNPMVGISTIRYVATGGGDYILTKYYASEGTIKLEGHCDAVRLSATDTWEISFTDPVHAVTEIISRTNFGMARPYTTGQYISNVPRPRYRDQITVSEGATWWDVLQYLAKMVGARLFFTARYAYMVDQSQIGGYRTGDITVDEMKPYAGNRLLIRDCIDMGVEEDPDDPRSYSFDLRSQLSTSRVGTRLYGSVDSPSSSESSTYNAISIKFRQDGKVKTYHLGMEDVGADSMAAIERIGDSELTDVADFPEEYLKSREDIFERMRNSVALYGVKEKSVDISALFKHIPEHWVRCMAWFILRDCIEDPRELSFTTLENYSAQNSIGAENSNDQPKTSFWSQTFPTVCEVKRFLDPQQDLILSSKSPLVGSYDPLGLDGFRCEKNYLAKYEHKYPKYMSTYTFGTQAVDTLSSNIRGTQVKLRQMGSDIKK